MCMQIEMYIIISIDTSRSVESPHCGRQAVYNSKSSLRSLSGGWRRVVGGTNAEKYEFPWVVDIQVSKKGEFKHICAGSVLNDYFIITAAHCVRSFKVKGNLKSIKLRLGTIDRNDDSEAIFMSVHSIHLHAKYDGHANDIALIRTNRPIKYRVNKKTGMYLINSICLPQLNEEPKGEATLIGWGRTGEFDPHADILQKVEIPLVSKDNCRESLKHYATVNDKMMCFGGQGGKDSCRGDSGGPLIQEIGNRYIIIGIVSFGIPCAHKGLPGVYTQISKYVNWIKTNAID